ncbi:MAG TPA: PfkB family carbohydrate kinase [Gemmatimonadota bacterium]|nr:PfkB family carbohydrate kinase [Gemmatimonadota bacterium]
MSILVVGSVALDDVDTPFGQRRGALGGAAVYFGLAASYFTDVRLVGVVGEDFPDEHVELLGTRGIDLAGLQVVEGETFRWGGKYGYDFNARETTYTNLGVFANFQPQIPETFRRTANVFLANIAPQLQLSVLEQVERPAMTALDTMNYWIERTPTELRSAIESVDILLINDSETRQLAGEPVLRKAAARVLEHGLELLVVKKGEDGVVTFSREGIFAVPGLPLDSIIDPTGAGDSFAGGFLGYLAATGDRSAEGIRRATIYGSVMGSLCCEAFSTEKLADLEPQEIEERFQEYKRLTHFEYSPILLNA